MTLTSAQLDELLALDPTESATKGALEALRRQARPAEAEMLDALIGVSTKSRFTSPFDHIPARAPNSKPEPLGPADIAWLERLPKKPAAVPDADVERLLELVGRTALGSGDRRLLTSILDPIRREHDRRRLKAEVSELRAAKRDEAPDWVERRLVDAITREGVSEDDAADRAQRIVTAALEWRNNTLAQRIRDRRDALVQLDEVIARGRPH